MDQSKEMTQPEITPPPSPDGNHAPDKMTPVVQPDHVPDKFWDQDQGIIRTDVLLKSYGELERRLGDDAATVPETPEAYTLTMPDEIIQPDADVNARLHAAGFTQAQMQLVYDLAHEKLSPLIAEMTTELGQDAAISQLETHFGGAAKWREISQQLSAWGKANLPAESFDSLSSSVEGVLAIHRMMRSGEPSLVGNQAELSGVRGEGDLKRMMRDPRYWRDQDPAFVEQIRRGFQALYPD